MNRIPNQMNHAMNSKRRLWVVVGCLLAAIAVGFGAIGAHWLEKWVADNYENLDEAQRRLELWETASRYLMYHAIGLLAVGLAGFATSFHRNLVGAVMLGGALLFSGCLYAYVLTDVKPLVHVVPLGGISMIVAWLMFAFFAMTNTKIDDGA